MEKTMKARIQHKHDIEANWLKATNFTPLAGEIIVYDSDENYDHPRIKTGDGKTNINDLPFIADYVLPVGGAELGGVKNGGNVVINPDGTMTASSGKVDFVAQDTPPEDTSVLWINTSYEGEEQPGSSADIQEAVNNALAQAKKDGLFDGEKGDPGDDYVLTVADKEEIAGIAAGMVEVPESSGGGIAVTGAKVGQTIRIAEVDENGVPTAWLPTDFPSGGGGGAENDNDWELINELTIGEEGVTRFLLDKDKNGNPFELCAMRLSSAYQASLGGTAASAARVKFIINGKDVSFNIGNINKAQRYFIAQAMLINGRIYWGHTDFSNTTNINESVSVRPMQDHTGNLYNDNSITSVGIRIDNAGTEYFAVGYKLTLWGRRK